jgi:hypothetical protein
MERTHYCQLLIINMNIEEQRHAEKDMTYLKKDPKLKRNRKQWQKMLVSRRWDKGRNASIEGNLRNMQFLQRAMQGKREG